MVLLDLQCLAALAEEIETKEQLALLVVQSLLFALDVRMLAICVLNYCGVVVYSLFLVRIHFIWQIDLSRRGQYNPPRTEVNVQLVLQVSSCFFNINDG